MEQMQMLAGSVAGLIFAAGSVDMLVKAWRTKDLRSYSSGQMVLNNIGNLFYWLYVISLPFGPIYFMHSFSTFVSLLMLIWYFAYQREPEASKQIPEKSQQLTSNMQAKVRQLVSLSIVQVRRNAKA